MNPWRILDSARVPGTREKLRLCLRSGVYSLRLGDDELMSSRSQLSERALGRIACERLAGRPRPRVLIGGLGMGFTLAAALDELGQDARVTVAELVSAVVEWNRRKLAALAGSPLEDRRVAIFEGDVADLLRKRRGIYDAILLDTDNGPVSFTRRGNGWLYSRAGLSAARESLRPSGILAVWSASPDRRFARRLEEAGFQVEESETPIFPGSRTLHTIWIAGRPCARRAGTRSRLYNSTMDLKIAIGTSGWSYDDWVGPFYPEGTPPARFLEVYSQRLRTVEVDATFYAVPARSSFEGWKARTPEGFLFSLKVPGIVTHGAEGERYDPRKVLVDSDGRLEQFIEKAAILGEKLAAVVFQFPYFRVREFQKAEFLQRLDAILSRVPPAVRSAVEVRNKSWIDEEYLSCLSRHRAAAVLIDHPYMPPPPAELHARMVTADFAYLRLLGDRYGIEKKTKTWGQVVEDKSSRIEAWSRVLAGIAGMVHVERILAYSNNHFAGHAPATCRELASKLGVKGAQWSTLK